MAGYVRKDIEFNKSLIGRVARQAGADGKSIIETYRFIPGETVLQMLNPLGNR